MDDWFVHVRSRHFAPRPGEEEEVVNEGMYGRAIGEYLRTQLASHTHKPDFLVAEDWGWWLELRDAPFTFGACIYCIDGLESGPWTYAITDSCYRPRAWSWKRFRFIDVRPWSDRLRADLLHIFESDSEIEVIGVFDEVFRGPQTDRLT